MPKKKQVDQVMQTQKLEALGMFAGGIAHDFNNILSIIEGLTSIAIRQLKEGRLSVDQLQKVLVSTKRGAGLTRQLLAFSRQKINLDEKIDIVDCLRQNLLLLRPLMGETVQVFMTLPEEPVWVEASDDHITQIILNLCVNARDAMPQGGEIAVMCMECLARHVPARLRDGGVDRRFLRLTVMDSGQGISPDVLPHIFDPFYSTKERGKGTGLGLSVIYGIIDQLGGAIEVSSKPGEGTTFDVFLPIIPSPEGRLELPEEDSGVSLAGKTILVAEDEPELRDVLVQVFSDMEMKVLTASNGNFALLAQEEYKGTIDFLLTDVVMPEMDGVRLGELFAAVRPDTSVVYMSGYPFIDGKAKDFNLPPEAAFISKPLQEEGIRRVLERALERKKARLGKSNGAELHHGTQN